MYMVDTHFDSRVGRQIYRQPRRRRARGRRAPKGDVVVWSGCFFDEHAFALANARGTGEVVCRKQCPEIPERFTSPSCPIRNRLAMSSSVSSCPATYTTARPTTDSSAFICQVLEPAEAVETGTDRTSARHHHPTTGFSIFLRERRSKAHRRAWRRSADASPMDAQFSETWTSMNSPSTTADRTPARAPGRTMAPDCSHGTWMEHDPPSIRVRSSRARRVVHASRQAKAETRLSPRQPRFRYAVHRRFARGWSSRRRTRRDRTCPSS